ncbi:hypothetical protein Fmac_021503 [Flemingia macrophylla]|uniref:Uncharacterized protein n=1 Tax=Flemingia macrophylla TaxID=520843 RepID=A0ABD1LX26_9FABA
MGFRLPASRRPSFTASQAASKSVQVHKGYIAVYVGETQKWFVIPISYLSQPSFQELLSQVEEEFGYDHPTGGLTIRCRRDVNNEGGEACKGAGMKRERSQSNVEKVIMRMTHLVPNVKEFGHALVDVTSGHGLTYEIVHNYDKGLKTGMYYLRSRSTADAIKFTVDTTAMKVRRIHYDQFL